jgi:streptogrisin C
MKTYISSALATACFVMATSIAYAQSSNKDEVDAAKVIADALKIPVGQALKQMRLQERAIELQQELIASEGDTFAGIVINDGPTPTLTIKGKGQARGFLKRKAKFADLESSSSEVSARNSINDLLALQQKVGAALVAKSIHTLTAINQEKNAIEVITLRDEEARTALAAAGLEAVDFFITHGDPEIQLDASIKGGQVATGPIGNCQTGFSVKAGTKRGVVTAGHCDDSLSVLLGTVNIGPMQKEYRVDTEGVDLQWHTDPAHLYPNEIVASATTVKITSGATIGTMVPGVTQVCLVRKTGATTCGKIHSTNYIEPTTKSGPWVGATDSTTIAPMSDFGDSGGPWYFGNKAFGIHRGHSGVVSFFTPVERLSKIGVTLATTP